MRGCGSYGRLCSVLLLTWLCRAESPSPALHAPTGGELLNEPDVVCLKSEDPTRPWKLVSASTYNPVNEEKIFICIHERLNEAKSKYDPDYTVSIYLKVGDKFDRLLRLEGNCIYAAESDWVEIDDNGRASILRIKERYYGTAAFVEERIFRVLPDFDPNSKRRVKLEKVEFVRPDASYKSQLREGEGVWKGVQSVLDHHGMAFEFYIWNRGDANCCPSAGRVTGRYNIHRNPDGTLRMAASTFKREPIPVNE